MKKKIVSLFLVLTALLFALSLTVLAEDGEAAADGDFLASMIGNGSGWVMILLTAISAGAIVWLFAQRRKREKAQNESDDTDDTDDSEKDE